MTHKTPEQIAEETLRHEYGLTVEDYPTAEEAMQKVLDVADDQTAADLLDTIAKAIEADRAQNTWQVLTGGTSRYPLAIIGAYATKFEAEAVAEAWNRVNGKHGIRYRVEEDA